MWVVVSVGLFAWTHPPAAAVCGARSAEAEVLCTHMTLTGYTSSALYTTVFQSAQCTSTVIFLKRDRYYFISSMLRLQFLLADVSPCFPEWFGSLPLCFASPVHSYVTQHLFIGARFEREVDGFQPQ